MQDHFRPVKEATSSHFVVKASRLQTCKRPTIVSFMDYILDCALTIIATPRSTHPSTPMCVKFPSNIRCDINLLLQLPWRSSNIVLLGPPPLSHPGSVWSMQAVLSHRSDGLVCLNFDVFSVQGFLSSTSRSWVVRRNSGSGRSRGSSLTGCWQATFECSQLWLLSSFKLEARLTIHRRRSPESMPVPPWP